MVLKGVLAYLDSATREVVPSAPLSGDTKPAEIFAARCSACHTLERIFQRLGEDTNVAGFWSHTVSRMRDKAPQWLSEGEAVEILEYLPSTSAM